MGDANMHRTVVEPIHCIALAFLISGCNGSNSNELTSEQSRSLEDKATPKTSAASEELPSRTNAKEPQSLSDGVAATSRQPNEVPLEDWVREDSFCRDVVVGLALREFLATTTGAKEDQSQSRPEHAYRVYRESQFMYEFLDGRLFAMRYLIPRSTSSAEASVEPYHKAFGRPTSTSTPSEFRELGATRFISWTLPSLNLRVNFAYLPSEHEVADVALFGQFINIDQAKAMLRRTQSSAFADHDETGVQSQSEQSRAEQELQEQIDDPKWGLVAAKIDDLCKGQLTPNEIWIHILKTVSLAEQDRASPSFTLTLLQKAERQAADAGLSPVFAVTSCQQSLAFGSSLNNQR
jgi:hypothetical protein